jgi:hypothetical protein
MLRIWKWKTSGKKSKGWVYFAVPELPNSGPMSPDPTIERILAELKPEAAYFFADDGQRSGSLVFDD